MKKLLTFACATAFALGVPIGVASAGGGNPAGTGQPSVECDEFPASPGAAANAPGAAFNEDGVSHAHYAGEQPQNSVNDHSVSQYDVACAKQ
jgi:hypothetical protein